MFAEASMVKNLQSKKGVSGVVTTVLLIVLVMAAVAIVWGIVQNTLNKQIDSSKSCFGNFEKVTINPVYTCYNLVSPGVYTVQFSLSIGDIEVDEVVVSVLSDGSTKGYTLITDETGVQVPGLANYDSTGFGTDSIKLPGINGGETYIANGFTAEPDLIKIKPTLDGEPCGVSDTISGIETCLL